MDYSINELCRIMKTQHKDLKQIAHRLYPDKAFDGAKFTEEEAEKICDAYILKKYPYLFGLAPSMQLFKTIDLYTISRISNMYGVCEVKIRETIKRIYPNRQKGERAVLYFTKQEVEEIIKNVKYRSGSMKYINGTLKIYW